METVTQVNARQAPMGRKEALKLAREANEILVAKGKKVTRLNLKKEKPDADTLAKLLLGPTGNLRAPTLRRGKTLIVGFDEATYGKFFG